VVWHCVKTWLSKACFLLEIRCHLCSRCNASWRHQLYILPTPVTPSSRGAWAAANTFTEYTIWWGLYWLLGAYLGEWVHLEEILLICLQGSWCSSNFSVDVKIQMHPENQVLCLSCSGGSTKYQDNAYKKTSTAHDDDLCVMCETREEETIEHLFFTCPFARQCWATLNFVWDHSLNLHDRFI
jgi:hypothetical protein